MKKKGKIIDFQKAAEQEQQERRFRKERAEAAPIWTALSVAGILAVAVYFAGSVANFLLDPFTTTIAYQYTSYDAISVSGILCREELVLEDASGLFFVDRQEGERVSSGGIIATVYQNEAALYEAQQVEELQLQLSQLEYAQSITSGSQEILKLDDNIKSTLLSLKTSLRRGDFTTFRGDSSNLKTMILKQDYTYSGESDVGEQIELLQQQIAQGLAATSQVSSFIRSPAGGLYSMLVDGYETVLTPEALLAMTPTQFRTLQPNGAVGSNLGKIITGDTWYYAALMEETEAPYVGQALTLKFQSGFDQEIPLTCVSVSKGELGQCLVVFEADRYLSATTLLRDQSGELILDTVEGIRVPKTALRLTEITPSEDEEPYLQSGVYCVMGRYARFKPVEILLEEEDYYLVKATPEVLGYTTQTRISLYTLREGDTVIVSGKDLYDGKVVS